MLNCFILIVRIRFVVLCDFLGTLRIYPPHNDDARQKNGISLNLNFKMWTAVSLQKN